jgi:hypothetical protein
MESSQALPAGGVEATDLAELTKGEGPFLTIVLATRADVENAAQRARTRWRTLRADLEGRDVPRDVLDAVEPVLADAHLSGDGVHVVADASGVRHVEHGPRPGAVDGDAWWEPVPRLALPIRWRQAEVPFVVALADRTGATLYGFRHGPEDRPDVERDVRGEADFPISKVAPGGWAQRRYQERAENTWEENAADVAEAVVRLAKRVDARLILLAGDVRALSLVQGSWPAGFDLPVEVVPGERPWEGSGPMVPDEAREVVDGFVERETRAIVERFREEKGQGDLAADGAAATLRALAAAQVAVLLLHEDADDDATAWIGPESVPVAATREDLETLGVERPIEVRRVDALIRAAIGTSAAIRFLPPGTGLTDGVGALLRWSDSPGS